MRTDITILEDLAKEFAPLEREAALYSTFAWSMASSLGWHLAMYRHLGAEDSGLSPEQREQRQGAMARRIDEIGGLLNLFAMQGNQDFLPDGERVVARLTDPGREPGPRSAEQLAELHGHREEILELMAELHGLELKDVHLAMKANEERRRAEAEALSATARASREEIRRQVDLAMRAFPAPIEDIDARIAWRLLLKAADKAKEWGTNALGRALEERMVSRQLRLMGEAKLYKPIAERAKQAAERLEHEIEAAPYDAHAGAEAAA